MMYGLYALLGGAILLGLGWFFTQRYPSYKRYKQETLYGVTWRWSWQGRMIVGLWPHCPQCGSELLMDDEHAHTSKNLHEKTVFFICNTCQGEEKGRMIGGDRRYAITLVQRELFRRVNAGEFLESMKEETPA